MSFLVHIYIYQYINFCFCVLASVYVCVHRCTCVHLQVEVRGQPWMTFLRQHLLLWGRVSYRAGTLSRRLHSLASNPTALSVSTSPVPGLQAPTTMLSFTLVLENEHRSSNFTEISLPFFWDRCLGPRWSWTQWPSCLSILSAGITVICYQV